MPIVSIIMPVYNAAPYLDDCLKSIVDQSFEDWELIACDDFSTDQSLTTLHKWQRQDGRIKVVASEEKGIIPALNTAYDLAQGSMITRMDADDLMPTSRLMQLHSKLQSVGKRFVVTGRVRYFRDDAPLGDGFKSYENWLNGLVDKQNWWREIYKECPIASPNWLLSREDFETTGGFAVQRYPEDYDLVFRMRQARLQVAAVEDITLEWRDHSTRTSRTSDTYADNRFLELKWHWFKLIDLDNSKELVIWGAGKKGKQLASMLIADGVKFRWVTNNPNKIGHNVYGVVQESDVDFHTIQQASQVLLLVANESERKAVLDAISAIEQAEVFAFC